MIRTRGKSEVDRKSQGTLGKTIDEWADGGGEGTEKRKVLNRIKKT